MLVPKETKLNIPNPSLGVVKLNSIDLTFLYHLYIHRSMTSGVIRELIQEISGRTSHPNAVTNRLRRLVKAKLLIRDEKPMGGVNGGLKRYQYRLTKRGYLALAELDLVNGDEVDKYLLAASRLNAYTLHNRSATMLASRIAHTYLAEKELHNVEFFRGSYHPFINQGVLGGVGKGLIIPDYIFENENVFVCIENDTGSQRGRIIQGKFEKYQELAKLLFPRKVYVVFSVVDDTLFEDLGDDRERRIIKIKGEVPSSAIWEENLKCLVVSAKDTALMVKDMLLQKYPLNLFERQDKFEEWFSLVSQQLKESFDCVSLYADDVFFATREKRLDGEGIVQLNRWDGEGTTMSVVFSELGSIRDLQVVREQVKQMEMLKEKSLGEKLVHQYRVLILYETEEELHKDVRRLPISPNIYVASIESWRKWCEGGVYTWYKVLSPYRLKQMEGFEL